MTFRDDIIRFTSKTKIRGDLVMRKLGFDAFAGVLRKSPVDEGRFRGNWRIGINRIDLTANDDKSVGTSTGSEPTGAEQGKAAELLAAKWEDEIFISNNLPYAKPLEDGHSKQAPGPQAILGRTVVEMKQAIQEAVRSLG